MLEKKLDGLLEQIETLKEEVLSLKNTQDKKFNEPYSLKLDEIKLYHLLKNFSDANGGDEIDWINKKQNKYYIYFDYHQNKFKIDYIDYPVININNVYFISEKVAEEAIRRYEKELREVYYYKSVDREVKND